MILKTNRLVLRPWELHDVKNLYKYAKEPEVGLLAGWIPHRSVDESKIVLTQILMFPNKFALFHKINQEVIGSIGLLIGDESHIHLQRDEAELGFWIGKPYWGQGLMVEAIEKVLSYAFDEMRLREVWCGCFEENEQSYRVQQKCGFTYQRTEKNTEWPIGIRTLHISSLPNSQWQLNIKYKSV